MQPWALVSPSSRGIGLALARRLLRTTSIPIVATARSRLDQARESILAGLDDVNPARLHVVHLDFLDERSVASAAEQVAQRRLWGHEDQDSYYLHLAFCLPGLLFPEKSPAQIEHDAALATLRTNTLGPMLLLKHFARFLPRKATRVSDARGLPRAAVWANMSARVGSIGDNRLGGWYSYRASKAAVNQLTKSFDLHLRTSAGPNAMSIGLHPGTVKTGLSQEFWRSVREHRLFSPELASEKLIDVVNSRGLEHRGKCFDWKGEEVPP